MSGRHRQIALSRRSGLRWLAGLVGLAMAGAVLLVMSPADAAQRHVKAQLSLSGVATKDNPAGGTQVGVRPGDSVTFSAAGVPTAGLAKLGLNDLVSTVDNLLAGAASFQVRADFSGLPGGHANTVLSGKKAVTFRFPRAGTYNFTWTVEKVTVVHQLLGGTQKHVSTINLNGNELKQAGIKLNAYDEYVGRVVAAKKPPQGGISVQLPSVHVAPSVTGVGQLPTVGVPGATPPTLNASVPNLPSLPVSVPNLPSLPNLPGSHQKHHQQHAGSHRHAGYRAPELTVPDEVVPNGNNAEVLPGTGNYAGNAPQGGTGLDVPGIPGGSHDGAPTRNSANHPERATPRSKTIDLASAPANPSSELPVILAIVSIIVLALVAGTYARLFLQRRNL